MLCDLRSKKEYTGEFIIEIGKIRIIFFIKLKILKWWLIFKKCKGKKEFHKVQVSHSRPVSKNRSEEYDVIYIRVNF